jgi:pilus assembly protein CpaD
MMRFSSFCLRASSLLILMGSVSACTTPSPALWSEADAHKEIVVRQMELDHDVSFASNSAELSQMEIKRIDDFVARQNVGYGDLVEIRVPGSEPRVEAHRAAAVGERLARSGIAFERGRIASPADLRIAVTRSVAIPPACPDWRKPDNDGDPSNTTMSNLGCANLRNLGLMVADPGELLAGRPSTMGAGEPLAAGVERYRTGKVTPLLDSDTSTTK